jgi:tetratricopeptide (TPR) repeat protein
MLDLPGVSDPQPTSGCQSEAIIERPRSRWATAFAGGLIVLAVVAAYSNSFSGPFVCDDIPAIVNNPTIRHLQSIGQVLSPPRNGETVSGRPLLNLSLGLNYALGSTAVWGYHAANLAIHVLNALLLLGILRRTFHSPALSPRFGVAGPRIAWAIALLWAVHPLQTESVTYVAQRAESLAALFYLLTLYCAIRGAEAARAPGWYAAAVSACFMGVASKEVTATAPLVVFLYDRTFFAGSFGQAWLRRRGLYLGLAATWVPLALLLIGTHGRGNSVGFSSAITAWQYALTQCTAIARYVRLSCWPSGLCLDYGVSVARTPGEIVPGALLLVVLASATLWALVRRPGAGFLGAFFLAMLAPTSSFVPIATQTIAEHRMYLALAALIAAAVVGGNLLLAELLRWLKVPKPRRTVLHGTIAAALVASATVALGTRTWLRNEDYRTEVSVWDVTVRQSPLNARAHYSLGEALATRGQFDEAIAQFQQALEIQPDIVAAHNNLGALLGRRGRFDEAVAHYRKALEIKPDVAAAHYNLGNALAARGQFDEAIADFQQALQIQPGSAEVHNNLANVLLARGNLDEAVTHYRKALEIEPGIALAHYNLGNVLATRGQFDEAIAQLDQALEIQPDIAAAHNNLGHILAGRGQLDEAIAHYHKALQIQPGHVNAQRNLAAALSEREELLKSLAERREALRLRPYDVVLLNDVAWMLATSPNASVRNGAEAVELAGRAMKLPGGQQPAVLGTLAAAYAEAGRFPEAVRTAEQALRLAAAAGDHTLAEMIRTRLELYSSGKPYRQPLGH